MPHIKWHSHEERRAGASHPSGPVIVFILISLPDRSLWIKETEQHDQSHLSGRVALHRLLNCSASGVARGAAPVDVRVSLGLTRSLFLLFAAVPPFAARITAGYFRRRSHKNYRKCFVAAKPRRTSSRTASKKRLRPCERCFSFLRGRCGPLRECFSCSSAGGTRIALH